MTKLQTPIETPFQPRPARRRLLDTASPLALSAMGLGALLLLALIALFAVDVLAFLVLCGAVFLIERTVGDWLSDALGPFLSKVLFVGGMVVVFGVMLSFSVVQDAIWGGLQKADELGFHSVLIDRLGGVERRGEVRGGGGGGGGGGGSASPGGSSTAPADDRSPSDSAPRSNGAATRTRSVLRLGGQGSSVVLTLDVIASGMTVDEGEVEFSIDGRRVATARVSAGRAQVRVGGVAAGPHRASARFLGTDRFAESTAEAAFGR